MTIPYRERQALHDYAREDRRQLILHTRLTPTLEEAFAAEQREQESRRDLIVLLVVLAAGAFAAVMLVAPEIAAWLGR